MAKLPEEVTRTLMASIPDRPVGELDNLNDEVKERTILQRLFDRIVALFSEASGNEMGTSNASCEMCDTESCPSDSENSNELNYGYPPAYGVPAPVATKLLTEVYSLLQVLKVDDESLNGRIEELKAKIAKALGIAGMSNSFADWIAEMRLAITAQQGTQPVLSVSEAKERLQMSWNDFKALVMEGQFAREGRVFDALFALRAAIESAIKTLSVVEMEGTKADETQSRAEGQTSEPVITDNVEIASEENKEPTEHNESVMAVAAVAKPMQANTDAHVDNDDRVFQASSEPDAERKEEFELASMSDKNNEFILNVLSSLSQQMEEINRRIAALEATVQSRRRVTQFVASADSTNETSADNDLLRRWRSAATESERRKILREAQKRLALPIALTKDI